MRKRTSPVNQKFHKHVVGQLDLVTFADWKLDLDSVNLTFIDDMIWDLWNLLAPLLEKNTREVAAQAERWVDFAANEAGFLVVMRPIHTASILMSSWRTDERYFTLIHEIGHFWSIHLLQTATKATSTPRHLTYVESSFYLWHESSSRLLEHQFFDDHVKHFAITVWQTYFPGITHLLEAANTKGLPTVRKRNCELPLVLTKAQCIMKSLDQEFWGDAVEIDDDAALTWMRQKPHYMGLYSYILLSWLGYRNSGLRILKNSENGQKFGWTSQIQGGESEPPRVGHDHPEQIPQLTNHSALPPVLSGTVDQVLPCNFTGSREGINSPSNSTK